VLVAFDDGVEGRAVAAPRPLDQLGVGHTMVRWQGVGAGWKSIRAWC
jgi:hypothetical protein